MQAEAIRAESIRPTLHRPLRPSCRRPSPRRPRPRRTGIASSSSSGRSSSCSSPRQLFTSFVAYTDDAYVRSDLIAIAPEVTGRIIAVHVVDNQEVKIGDKLRASIPSPSCWRSTSARPIVAKAEAS